MYRLIITGLIFAGLAASQWLGSIEDAIRSTSGVERVGSAVTVYCGGLERTFNFTAWPPFAASGENIMSTKLVDTLLFSVLIGFDGTDVTVSASSGDSSATR